MQQKEGKIVRIATNNQDIRMASEALFRAIVGGGGCLKSGQILVTI